MHRLEFDVQRPAALPADDYWQMLEATQDVRRQELAAERTYEEGARRLAQEHAARRGELVAGAKGGREGYDTFRRGYRERLRGLREVPDEERDARRHELLAESDRFLADIGLDLDGVRRADADLQRELAVLAEATYGIGRPAEMRPRVKNLTVTPPYNGSIASVSLFKAQGDPTDNLTDPTFGLWLDRSLGKLGCSTGVHVDDASDYDEATARAVVSLVHWYQMPKQGQVQVRFKAQWSADHTDGSVENEWGESSLSLTSGAPVFARVLSPMPTLRAFYPGLSIGFKIVSPDDHQWSSDNAPIGFTFDSGNVVVPEVFAKGQWVLVELGMDNRSHFVANDTTVTCHRNRRLFVQEIGISVA